MNYFLRLRHNPKTKLVLIHLLVWIIYIAINNVLLFYNSGSSAFFGRTLFTYPLVAVLFYVNAHEIADRFIPKKQFVQLVFATLLLISGYILLRYCTFYYLFPLLKIPFAYRDLSLMLGKFSLDSVWIALQYLLFSYGYWFAFSRIKAEQEKRKLEVAVANLDKEKAEVELAFLQAQINPHFLYNTFNFLYSEAYFVSPKLADAIMALSVMMRTITEVGKQHYQPLDKVLDTIENYIKIQQYRFSDKLLISLEVEGEEYLDYTQAPPLVFITLIENIFKHGDLTNAEHPCQIRFVLTENTLSYTSHNRKRHGPVERSTGIGMTNLEHQLRLLYPNRFSLEKKEDDYNFSLELNILDTSFIGKP